MKLPGEITVPSRVNGIEAKPVRVAASSAVQRRLEQPAGQTTAGDTSADVRLSGRAQQLSGIEQALRALPAINEQRVAEVKQRLENGDYEVDPQRVADKLLHLETDLQRVSPLDRASVK